MMAFVVFLAFVVCCQGKTRSRAEAKQVTTARLPIDKYMERKRGLGNHSFSNVLAVNQGIAQNSLNRSP